ncbi:MAG: Fe(2+)-trafficking protein, partial [Comamonas sp.]
MRRSTPTNGSSSATAGEGHDVSSAEYSAKSGTNQRKYPMARMVQCIKLHKEAEGLDFPPYPGELGKR